MARNLIMGSYLCNLGHSHSTSDEVVHCNKMEEDERKRQHQLKEESISLELKNQDIENNKLEVEKKRIEMEHAKLEKERESERMKHEQKMEELRIEKIRAENQTNESKHVKSKLCSIS